ncbi:ParB/RepB/Spo0J family partition protein [Thomasclavelia spiroformis]|mgnify:CR=1 FL=1|jgi:ParB family chromosome partitioning protein|uniref:ParB/RepB/Spo0J family partition protein n=1 Tax=Thomasclavelia spiroformis TaxID=29348 RepID=UPI00241F18EE|nr:ParB/RepB/Spo0J family partition protein [Thomasclavelia spiroformis]
MEYVYKVVNLQQLDEFPNHPYQIRIDEDLRNLQKSIMERGVDEPLIVRKIDDRYQVISGHRRMKACQLAEINDIPVRIVDLNDDEAVIMMVDSNLQRRKLLKSELAFAYRMKYEALKHQGKVIDEASYPVDTKYNTDSAQRIANEKGTSRAQIFRYIRLTYLNKELLNLVDEERIAFRPAVELSFLNDKQQEMLLKVIEELDATPSLSQAKFFKELAQDDELDEETIYDELLQEKPNQKEKLKLEASKLRQYFPRGVTPLEMQEAIFYLLEEHSDELEQYMTTSYELKI